jgi:hypothetical protein
MALPAAGCIAAGLATGADNPLFIIYIGTAGICLFLATAFVYLRVRDAGTDLEVAFGPVGLFGRKIPYDRIESVETTTVGFIHGWGVHGLPFFAITYRITGTECVRIDLKKPIGLFRFRRVYIGTDDPERLTAHISSRIAPD